MIKKFWEKHAYIVVPWIIVIALLIINYLISGNLLVTSGGDTPVGISY